MYIPMYKNRRIENSFLNNYSSHFDNEFIIPYIEIISNNINSRHDLTENELVEYYDEVINGKYFIDFYTFDQALYSQINLGKLMYSFNARTDDKFDYYSKLLSTLNSEKAIPVFSIKQIRENILEETDIKDIILNLQQEKEVIALRIEAKLYSKYSKIINNTLRRNDYLFFDISEENKDPYFFDLLEIKEQQYKKILANSPRKRNLNNTSYLECGYTDLINNFAMSEYKEEGFNGFADYSGLKDDLPKKGGGGQGAALAMLYCSKNNKFFTIVNKNTSDGVRGYKNVLVIINKEVVKQELDSSNCLAYEYINKKMSHEKSGNYSTWNYVTLVRMLSEIKKIYR